MGKISTNDFRKRLKILIEGQPYIIIENEFVKPGKGQAFNRVRMKSYLTGKVLERTFKSGEMVEEAVVTMHKMNYLYNDGTNYSLMDQESFETLEVPKDAMGGAEMWLLDNTEVEVTMWEGKVIEVVPPIFMELTVTDAPPGLRGDTSGSVTRPAKLETGAQVNIPLFIDEGTKIKVDTRTGEYVERAKS